MVVGPCDHGMPQTREEFENILLHLSTFGYSSLPLFSLSLSPSAIFINLGFSFLPQLSLFDFFNELLYSIVFSVGTILGVSCSTIPQVFRSFLFLLFIRPFFILSFLFFSFIFKFLAHKNLEKKNKRWSEFLVDISWQYWSLF
jgi:hypothetical protein